MGWVLDSKARALAIPGDVSEVRMVISRDDTGIDYEVCTVLRSLERASSHPDDAEIRVWYDRVNFGQTDATVAGGSAFVSCAREQERVAHELWHLSHAEERA